MNVSSIPGAVENAAEQLFFVRKLCLVDKDILLEKISHVDERLLLL